MEELEGEVFVLRRRLEELESKSSRQRFGLESALTSVDALEDKFDELVHQSDRNMSTLSAISANIESLEAITSLLEQCVANRPAHDDEFVQI